MDQDCSRHSGDSALFEGPDFTEGARGQTREALLVPQDGVLVVELQLLHRCSTCVLSAAVPVFHHLKGFLQFPVPANKREFSL